MLTPGINGVLTLPANTFLLYRVMSQKWFGRGESKGDSHTFDLIKLFTYPHMPPGSFAGAHEGRARAKASEGEHSSDLALGERKFNDMQGGKAQVTSRD